MIHIHIIVDSRKTSNYGKMTAYFAKRKVTIVLDLAQVVSTHITIFEN
ncbi:MAG: hypothetical protein LBQ13_03770 [Endomicrobium sp.]|nr:hypothetical protein [Endomicrobium sp.]